MDWRNILEPFVSNFADAFWAGRDGLLEYDKLYVEHSVLYDQKNKPH